ncbi:MAG: helix-turn-helix domain-containing protein [Patescibacteria group bacterium]
MQAIPQKIRELRQKANLTQNALAERSGVSPAFVYKLEAGEYETLSIETCRQLAKGFGMGLQSFLSAVGLFDEEDRASAAVSIAHEQKSYSHIAIMGVGMVGGALDRYFKTQNIEAGLFDPVKGHTDVGVLEHADTIFIAVPTPYYFDGGFDDSFLHSAIQTIPAPGKTIVLKSTIQPGTTEKFQALYPQHRFLFNPEFLTETTVDHDMQYPTRQIVGYTTESRRDAEKVLGMLPHAPFEKITHVKVAELVKYFGNAFYALKVSYANQMYDLCSAMGVDYEHVKECAQAESWIGKQHLDVFHKGYRGYGGKCLPKDMRSIIQIADALGVDLAVLKAAEAYNTELQKKQGIDVRWTEGSPEKGEATKGLSH